MLSFYLAGLKKLFSIGKKIFLVIAVYFIVISLFMHFINKDKPKLTQDPIKKNREEIYKVINDPKLNKTKEGKLQIAMYRLTMCGLVGEACSKNPRDGDKNFNNSMFGFISKLIITPYANPPASGVWWAYDGLQNTGFAPKIYAAQGIGFGSIKPLSQIWTAMRDFAYTLLVLIIIGIGFMIMFRMKLNPQTVISIENALPKIVISLILITFSFPIAGFLIDLMYLTIAIIISILAPAITFNWALGPKNVVDLQNYYLQAGPERIIEGLLKNNWFNPWNIIWTLPNALLDLIPLFGGIIKLIGSIFGAWLFYPWLFHNIGLPIFAKIGDIGVDLEPAGLGVDLKGIFVGGANGVIAVIVLFVSILLGSTLIIPLAIGILILLTVFFIFFRILFLLFSSYGKIILSIIIAPLYLIFEAVPGQSAFSSWLKNLISELIVFPTVVTIFIIGSVIIDKASSGETIAFPFLYEIKPENFSIIIGMILLFMTPDLVKSVKQFFVPKPGLLEGAGLGVFFGGATTGFSGGVAEISKYAGLGYYIHPVGKLLERIIPGFKIPSNERPPGIPG